MTIAAYVVCTIITAAVLAAALGIAFGVCENTAARVLTFLCAAVIIVGTFIGFRWYFTRTAKGRREMIDERSNLSNGIERVINIYTADGELMAQYEGKIDLDVNDGGYIKFDFEGKRYIYYNCFVETIAEIP